MGEKEKEELLEEAKLRYPKRTKFKSAQSSKVFIVKGEWKVFDSGNVSCLDETSEFLPYLKFEGKWAEIISKPEPEVINNYQIY